MKKKIVALRFPDSFDEDETDMLIIALQEPFIDDLEFDGKNFISLALPDPFCPDVIWALGYSQLSDEFFKKAPKQIEQDIIDVYKEGITPCTPSELRLVFYYFDTTKYDFASFITGSPYWRGAIWYDDDEMDRDNLEVVIGIKSSILRVFSYIHRNLQESKPSESIKKEELVKQEPKPTDQELKVQPKTAQKKHICRYCFMGNETDIGPCEFCGAPL